MAQGNNIDVWICLSFFLGATIVKSPNKLYIFFIPERWEHDKWQWNAYQRISESLERWKWALLCWVSKERIGWYCSRCQEYRQWHQISDRRYVWLNYQISECVFDNAMPSITGLLNKIKDEIRCRARAGAQGLRVVLHQSWDVHWVVWCTVKLTS